MRLGIARWAAPAAIVLLAITLHWSLLDKGFVSDDLSQVLNNPYLRSPRSLGQIFSSHVWSFRGPEEKSNYYRPMMHLLYMACYGLFGLESAGFHAANLLFHAGCSLLVFYLGRALGAAWCAGPSALLAALLFAVHPVHTEAIAWIAAVTELSYAFFFLLSVYLYVRGRPAWSAAVAMLALLSKETALMLLPLLVVYEHWFRKPGGRRAYLYHLVPLVIYLALRIQALGGLVMVSNPFSQSLSSHVYSTVYLTGIYLSRLASPAPFHLQGHFGGQLPGHLQGMLDPAISLPNWGFLLCSALVACLAGAAAWLRWRGQGLWFAGLWVVLLLAPVLYPFRVVGANYFAERYLYLPSVGFCWIVAALFRARPTKNVACVFLLLNYGLLTYYRSADWRQATRVFVVSLQPSPKLGIASGQPNRGTLPNISLRLPTCGTDVFSASPAPQATQRIGWETLVEDAALGRRDFRQSPVRGLLLPRQGSGQGNNCRLPRGLLPIGARGPVRARARAGWPSTVHRLRS